MVGEGPAGTDLLQAGAVQGLRGGPGLTEGGQGHPGGDQGRLGRRSRSPRRSRSFRRGHSPSSQSRSGSRYNRPRPNIHPPAAAPYHAVADDVSDDESAREDDEDDYDVGSASRSKRLKRIDVSDPLSAFATKTKTRLGHIPASEFCKANWNTIRGMDPVSGKFLVQDRPKPDDWLKMAKSDRLINKWSGDPAFADTRLDDGVSSVVPKNGNSKRRLT